MEVSVALVVQQFGVVVVMVVVSVVFAVWLCGCVVMVVAVVVAVDSSGSGVSERQGGQVAETLPVCPGRKLWSLSYWGEARIIPTAPPTLLASHPHPDPPPLLTPLPQASTPFTPSTLQPPVSFLEFTVLLLLCCFSHAASIINTAPHITTITLLSNNRQ